jgi:hypothetical protein
MAERIIEGELEIGIEGATINYEPPFRSWVSHHLYIQSRYSIPTGRIEARTFKDGLGGCSVVILHFPPPKVVGKDQNGNAMLEPQPPAPLSGKITWKAVGE